MSPNPQRTIKACITAGARPNFMKVAPLIRAMEAHNQSSGGPLFEPLLVHTGQHYDREMSDVFFEELGIMKPHVSLGVGSGGHGAQTGRLMIEFEKVVLEHSPGLVIVIGDVNSTVACALVAAKLHVQVAHVESGFRSFDKSMPEEINRVLTDHMSDYLFAPSEEAMENLRAEGISPDICFHSGDIMADNLFYNLEKAKNSPIRQKLGLQESSGVKDYAFMTMHRASNVDERTVLKEILLAVKEVSESLPVIFPVHPRTLKMIRSFELDRELEINIPEDGKPIGVIKKKLVLLPPVGYIDCLALISGAGLILTDSGGIQEEAWILQKPCLTLRETTERPYTLFGGLNALVGHDRKKILQCAERAIKQNISGAKDSACPEGFPDGKTADRIISVLAEKLS